MIPASTTNKLFLAILLIGFHGLMRLSELTQPDAKARRSFSKLTMRHTLKIMPATFSFHLPYHKGDRFFEGNTVLIEARSGSSVCPYKHLSSYIADRDHPFPLYPELWLTTAGDVPTYSWFVKRLRNVRGSDVAGHLLRSGGATALALVGVCDDLFQVIRPVGLRHVPDLHPETPGAFSGSHPRQTRLLLVHLTPGLSLPSDHLPTPPFVSIFL
jgi:hypothetical protein